MWYCNIKNDSLWSTRQSKVLSKWVWYEHGLSWLITLCPPLALGLLGWWNHNPQMNRGMWLSAFSSSILVHFSQWCVSIFTNINMQYSSQECHKIILVGILCIILMLKFSIPITIVTKQSQISTSLKSIITH